MQQIWFYCVPEQHRYLQFVPQQPNTLFDLNWFPMPRCTTPPPAPRRIVHMWGVWGRFPHQCNETDDEMTRAHIAAVDFATRPDLDPLTLFASPWQ